MPRHAQGQFYVLIENLLIVIFEKGENRVRNAWDFSPVRDFYTPLTLQPL